MSFPDDIHMMFSVKIGGEGMFGSGLKYVIFGLILAGFGASSVCAQDALPQTAGDLDGFKLEPLPQTPNRPPPDEPLIMPRIENETGAAPAGTRTSTPPLPAPNMAAPRPSSSPNARIITNPPVTVNRPPPQTGPVRYPAPAPAAAQTTTESGGNRPAETEPTPPNPRTPANMPPGDINNEPASPEPVNGPSGVLPGIFTWWLLALLPLIGVLILVWRRRVARPKIVPTVTLLPPLEGEEEQKHGPDSAPVPIAPPPVIEPALSVVELGFDASLATIGLFNLTIKGRLTMQNHGNEPVNNLRLRSCLLSSSMQQAHEITAFHDGQDHVMPVKQAMLYPGETMVVDVVLTMPKAEFMGFKVGEKEIFVPLIIAQLSYIGDQSGSAGQDRLENLVGREVHPPRTKMAPLFTDKDVQSVNMVGCRPLTA